VADRFQTPRAAWRGKRPRVAAGLSAQATTRLGAALTPPASARPLPSSHFASGLPSSSQLQPPSSRSPAARHWRRQLAPSSSIPTATLHRLPSNPLRPTVPAVSTR